MAQHANNAQQAFSYNSKPCLQSGIPALEALHTTWKNRTNNSKYELFLHCLEMAMDKVKEYYDKTATSDAYTFVMGALIGLGSVYARILQFQPIISAY